MSAANATQPQVAQIEVEFGKLLQEKSGFTLDDLDRSATFLELGFDSLFLIQLCQAIKKRLGVKVSFRQLIEEISTVDQLIPHLAKQRAEAGMGGEVTQPQSAATPIVIDEAVNEHRVAIPKSPAPASAPSTSANPIAPASEPTVVEAAVVARVAPAPSAPPAPLTTPPIPPGSSQTATAYNATPLQRVVLEQTALMAKHLELLAFTRSTNGSPVPATSTPQAVVAPISTAATTPAEATTPVAEIANDEAECNEGRCEATIVATENQDDVPPVPKARERFGPYKPIRRDQQGLTEQQDAHIRTLCDRFTSKTMKSRSLAQKHRSHFADPRTVAGYRRVWKTMVYQIAVEKSKGCKLWDVDGNQYIDVAMGFGLNLFGQSPDFVTKAITDQMQRGVEVGPQTPLAGETAELLCRLSRKDRATFCCTGSEAVMAAMRLSRTVTGKDKIVFFNKDYHGNFDEVLLRSNRIGNKQRTAPAAPGVPQWLADNVMVLEYGTQEALDVIRSQADEIAGVLVEPVQAPIHSHSRKSSFKR